VTLAERNNPAYRRAINVLELNQVDSREAWLQLLPRPQLSLLSTNMSWNLQRVGTDPFGNPLPNPEAQMVQSSQSRQQASLGFSFSFADYIQFSGRGDLAATRNVTAASQLHELHADVWRAYLHAQQAQVTAGLEQALLERQALNRDVAGRLYALAQRERIDLLEADLDIAVQEEQLRRARAELSTALLQLRNVIGDAGLEVGEVEPISFRAFDPAGLDDTALVRVALGASPAIALQEAEIRRAGRQITQARYQQWLPTLTVGFAASRNELSRDGGGAFFELNPSGGWDRNLTIGVSFPDLGRYFGNQNRIRSQQVAHLNAEETLRQRRLEVEQSIRTTLVELRSAHASVALQERRVQLAEQRLADRLESYRLGRGTYQDLQAATDAIAAAERALLSARYQLERALVTLEQTLAMPLESIAILAGS
jgi:outer membrane protein TolC